MKSTQIFLQDEDHQKMVRLVALKRVNGEDCTNQKFIIEATREKIERESKE